MKATTTSANNAHPKDVTNLFERITYSSVSINLLSQMIFDCANSGSELILNESLHFGMGLYAYTTDLCSIDGCSFSSGKNPLFSHVELSVDNIACVLSHLYNQCGYIEISGTPVYLDIAA